MESIIFHFRGPNTGISFLSEGDARDFIMLGKEVVWVVEILVSIPISDRENSNLQPSFIAELICFNILRRGELGRYALH